MEHDRQLVVAAKLVEEMRAAILKQTGYTCSAGIAHNKVNILSNKISIILRKSSLNFRY